jgi:predicted nucleic acid-binding protein
MPKKIAVLVRDRQAEALRMAVGLTIVDDEVSVFVMDEKLGNNEAVAMNLEILKEVGVKIYSNNPENDFEQMSTDEIACALLYYDSVIPY